MNAKLLKRSPLILALFVIAAVCGLRLVQPDALNQVEWKTLDWRVKTAARFPHPVSTNLGFVFISDDSIAALNNGLLGNRYGLYWPRHVYGRLIRELSAQDAKAVALDVLFKEARPDHAPIQVRGATNSLLAAFVRQLHPRDRLASLGENLLVESDEFLAWQMLQASNVIIAAEKQVLPLDLLRSNTFMVADISAEKDTDGVLRRAQAFKTYRRWHPLFVQAASEYGLDLQTAQVETNQIALLQPGGDSVKVPIGPDGCFALADFVGDKVPPGTPQRAKPFMDERVWHMGVVLAATQLQLDLAGARGDVDHGKIRLGGTHGVERVIPVDSEGFFYINWEILPVDPRLTKESIESLLRQDLDRRAGRLDSLTNRWQGKLVIVGSTATGNDLTDRGATPVEKEALLVSKHWNVANSILMNRFVHRTPLWVDLLLIAILGAATASMTWSLRPLAASLGVLLLAAGYCAACVLVYAWYRCWLPLVLPVLGALLVEHLSLVTYRVVFEERERRKVRSFFAKLVSPNIVQELLKLEQLSLGGARREVTVLFADVRGFTEFTDRSHEAVAEQVRQRGLSGEAAEALYNEQARETLKAVNLYLATVADVVKKHAGTLDKFIGDCVMAFWGAPTPNSQHALACVRAAIDAQRSIYQLNLQRAAENQRIEQENVSRAAAGLPPLSTLPLLLLGSGINTGPATVGLMGSDAHILNFTVFGREVNIASRLESRSGRSRIFVGEATFKALQRDDPDLASRCVALQPETVKGIREAVQVHEVPWMEPVASPSPNQGGG